MNQIPWNKGELKEKLCKSCSDKFMVHPFRENKAKFCSYKCYWSSKKGVLASKETKEKMSESHKGEKHPMFGRKHTDSAKMKMSKAKKGKYSGRLKIIGLKGLLNQQNSKKPTSIEKAVYDYLILKGIIFEKQKLINGKFIVDAYIPSLNLVIEADGSYWHSLDRVIKKDKAENAYLKKCGFNIFRLSEKEIRNGSFQERMVL